MKPEQSWRLPVRKRDIPSSVPVNLLQQDQQLLGQHHPSPQQQQLPLAEYHGAGGGMMDGQMGMHGLPMYRQQPPQPPRMRRGAFRFVKPGPCTAICRHGVAEYSLLRLAGD